MYIFFCIFVFAVSYLSGAGEGPMHWPQPCSRAHRPPFLPCVLVLILVLLFSFTLSFVVPSRCPVREHFV